MYRIFFLLILLTINIPSFSETRSIVTQTPLYKQYYSPQAYYGGDYIPHRIRHRYAKQNQSIFPDINDLEKYAMNKNFFKESDRLRLERLETLAFGAIQNGDYTTRYNNVRNAILSRPKPNYKTSLFRNISDYFEGQITGYTPPIDSINDTFYASPYGKNSVTNYSNPWGYGTSINNYGTTTGVGVKILD